MLGCLRNFKREISRIAVDGIPSSSSNSIVLTATLSVPCLSRARKTVPYVPMGGMGWGSGGVGAGLR